MRLTVENPNLERIKQVLRTEHECVSRDCNRDCGNCDLVMDSKDILQTYEKLIMLVEQVESLKSEYLAYHLEGDDYWRGVEHSLEVLNRESLLY